tara:strand:+ start:7606 stop:8253 length:648 start_codon:yes stop_codon:yes gene_type:complete
MTCLLLAACDKPAENQTAAVATEAPAGHYTLDKSHASVIFRVNHIGFSTYTGAFAAYDATLEFDPANPSAMKFDGTVDVVSLTLSNPPAGFINDLLGAMWFEAEKFPTISFHSTAVEMTGPNTANVTGDFTLHGVTKPLVLAVTFNGGYAGNAYDPNARIGFSATGTLKRSEFGLAYGVPEPGTTMGVGDDVHLTLESEFNGPPLEGAAAAPDAH